MAPTRIPSTQPATQPPIPLAPAEAPTAAPSLAPPSLQIVATTVARGGLAAAIFAEGGSGARLRAARTAWDAAAIIRDRQAAEDPSAPRAPDTSALAPPGVLVEGLGEGNEPASGLDGALAFGAGGGRASPVHVLAEGAPSSPPWGWSQPPGAE